MQKIFIALFLMVFASGVNAQFKDYRVKGGVQYNVISPSGEFVKDLSSFLARGWLAFELGRYIDVELGGGYMKWKQKDQYNGNGEGKVEAELIPIDLRFRLEPFGGLKSTKYVNPYGYIGAGMVKHKIKSIPVFSSYKYPYDSTDSDAWHAFFPAGVGLEIRLAKQVILDLQVGTATTLTDKVNASVIGDPKDGWFNYALGLTVTGRGGREDSDRDGLYDDEEEDKYGTDPENADTDGDGLKDGEEVKTYKTDPKNPDTDNDGLNDGDEVKKHMTNPLNADTDGDGLKDGEEVLTYGTNPLITDTDGDGLTDGSEVRTYNTDPLKRDTDGDGLTDGEEVNKHRTDPLKADTDNGSIDDGTEVRRGTNPLDPSDDVKKEEIKVGEVIILEGINFETNSSRITPESETILMKAYNTMKNNPEIEVEISGHTDSRGSAERNQKLSEDRANAVKDWLVAKGIDPKRITTVGYGEDKPIAPNDSPENMAKNRRIEFKRIK
ncbi:MAG: OmpA family protein [Ignavibacteria bacterium]|nr:OmpA family protein [Ignavibacteria bacterium]